MRTLLNGRLSRLEAAQHQTGVPCGYVCGVDLADLERKTQALPPGSRRITGFVVVSPDDWECIDDESNG